MGVDNTLMVVQSLFFTVCMFALAGCHGAAAATQSAVPSFEISDSRIDQARRDLASVPIYFREDEVNPFYCAENLRSDTYDVTLSMPHESFENMWVVMIDIYCDGERIYGWKSHDRGTFCIQDDRLYFTDYNMGSNGGWIVAVNLSTGKEAWRSKLLAIGETPHSAYENRIKLSLADSGNVVIVGRESAGSYIEIKDKKTGETLINQRVHFTESDSDE